MSTEPKKETVASIAMRDLILDEATQAFAMQGFHGVKVSKLCKQAGIANGTFYIYYRDKDALYQAVMQRAAAQFLAALREADREGASSPEAADLRDLEIIVDFSAKHPWLALAVFNERGFRNENPANIHSMMVQQRSAIIREGQGRASFERTSIPNCPPGPRSR